MEDLKEVIRHFTVEGKVIAVSPIETGHINSTYKVVTEGSAPDYLLQRINHHVFRDVDVLQHNIQVVTDHIRKKLEARGVRDLDRRVLRIVPTADRGLYYFNGSEYWRMMLFIKDAYSYDIVDEKYSRCAGATFGDFQYMLSDLKEPLKETIPDFHNIEFRIRQLKEAVELDKVARKKETGGLIDALLEREVPMCRCERLFREGRLPKRICHCDTKVNNMLFDKDGNVLCVIDLDTVMPSYIFSDYGDFLRTAASTAAEDEKDLDKIEFNMDIYNAFTEGYLSSARKFLLPVEIEHLPYAAALFPYMQAVRFLCDYLNGDTYYKTAYPEHNLVRTKAQFKLLQSIEQKLF